MKAQAIGLACLFVLAAVAAVRGQSHLAGEPSSTHPEWFTQLNGLGKEHKWDEAIALVREAAASDPPATYTESALHHLAWLLSIKSKDRLEDSLEFYQLAIDKFPESPLRANAWCGIANVYANRLPVDRESARKLREQVVEAYEKAFAITSASTDSGNAVRLPDSAHEVLARHYVAANDWERALPVLQTWRPGSFCGTCDAAMLTTRDMSVLLCLIHLGRFDEAVVHAWRDVSPESSLTRSSFGPFVLMRLYSEAGQFGDLERQVDDYVAASGEQPASRRLRVGQASSDFAGFLERARHRKLTDPVELLRTKPESTSDRTNPAEYQIARWLLIRGGDKSVPLLEQAAHQVGGTDMRLVEVLAEIDCPAARDSLVRLAVAGNIYGQQSVCGMIRSRVKNPEELTVLVWSQVPANRKQFTTWHTPPAPLAFRLAQPWTPPARGSLPKAFPQEVFAKPEGK